MIEVNRLHAEHLLVQKPAVERKGSVEMQVGESFPEVRIGSLDAFRMDRMDMPVHLHSFLEVPGEATETGVHHFGRLRRPPDDVGLGSPVVCCPEKSVEPADVVDVKVREEKVIDSLNLGAPESVDAPLAAVKEKPVDRLARGEVELIVEAAQRRHAVGAERACLLGAQALRDRGDAVLVQRDVLGVEPALHGVRVHAIADVEPPHAGADGDDLARPVVADHLRESLRADLELAGPHVRVPHADPRGVERDLGVDVAGAHYWYSQAG